MHNHLKDIEQIVLGSLIIDTSTHIFIESKITENLFEIIEHRMIYKSICNNIKNFNTTDLILLTNELTKTGYKNLINYSIDITKKVASVAHLEHHIMILVERQVRKDLKLKFSKIINLSSNLDVDIFDLREIAIKDFDDLFLEKFIDRNKTTLPFPHLINSVEQSFNALTQSGVAGIQSSLDIINKTSGGWRDSDLVIVAGRPGMGKSAFMVQQILDVSLQDKSVGIFSLEMSAEQITGRIINNYMNIPNSSTLRKGLSNNEYKQYYHLKDHLNRLKIHIDDTPAISIDNLRLKAKMMKLQHNIDILFIDYLQLITNEKAYNREQEIGKISRSLAKELNIPIIALSQLSRALESRNDKRPFLSDLRDSGSIEQDADEVIFLYRPEYYGIANWYEYNNAPTANEAEIIIAKNRHGGTLAERCRVNMSISKFENLLN